MGGIHGWWWSPPRGPVLRSHAPQRPPRPLHQLHKSLSLWPSPPPPLVLRDSSPPFGHPIRVSWASLPSFAYSLVVFPTPSHLSRPLVPFLASYNQRRPRAFHSDNPASLARRPIAAPPSDRRNTESLAWPPLEQRVCETTSNIRFHRSDLQRGDEHPQRGTRDSLFSDDLYTLAPTACPVTQYHIFS